MNKKIKLQALLKENELIKKVQMYMSSRIFKIEFKRLIERINTLYEQQ